MTESTGWFFMFGISVQIVLHYIHNVGHSVFDALVKDHLAEVVWPCTEELEVMRVLFFGFPQCVALVDGTRQYCFRPRLTYLQEERCKVHHNKFCHANSLWTDVNGVIIWTDISLDCTKHDLLYTTTQNHTEGLKTFSLMKKPRLATPDSKAKGGISYFP